ncbi:ABC transporter ATP-binding protein [Micromonospora sp. NPDC049230]|uniref:ABC transporter ATP-binding protein n=1 Tax=Micromonospora sp. NPDC049230 TaxID=3155502 RepID=UPI00340B5299
MTGTSAGARGRALVVRSLLPGRRLGFALVVSVLATTVLPVLAPQFTLRFVDDAMAGASTGHLVLIAVGYLSVAIAALAARTVTGWLANGLAWDGTNRLRERLAEHALSLDLGYHGKHPPGELIERVDGDVAAVADFAVAFLLDVVVNVLLLGAIVVGVFLVDVRLGAVLTGYCLVVFLAMARGQRWAVPSATRSRAASAALYGELEESLAGAEDLRANGAGEHMLSRFHRTSAAWYQAEYRAARIGVAVMAGVSVAFAGGTAVVLGSAAWLLNAGALTVGTAVLLLQYTLLLRAPFERLIDQLRAYQGALASVTRVADLLGHQPVLPQPVHPRQLPASGPLSARLDRVSFTYPGSDRPSLFDVDIELAAGESLGLVGRTGSGKTTIARLLLRMYDPDAGAVCLGGLDLRDVDSASLRRRAGMVTQDVQLFSTSIRDNLTLFRPDTDDDRLRAVLHEVGLGEWFAAQPEGLDSALRGVSAGEAQLLAFARTLLSDPGIVVLDEPSSRLDLATERRVEECIDRLLAGRTGVVIAHRLSVLSRMDKIAVVSGGRIVEFGYRTDLLADSRSRFVGLLNLTGAAR